MLVKFSSFLKDIIGILNKNIQTPGHMKLKVLLCTVFSESALKDCTSGAYLKNDGDFYIWTNPPESVCIYPPVL